MIRMILWLLLPIMLHAADYSHNLQFNVTLAKSYFNYDTGMTSIPITGTKNMRIELVDTTLDQPFWFVQRDMPINNGQLTVMIDDDSLDWVALLTEKDLVLRVTITGQETNSPGSAETVDFVDIPFEFLPFAMVSEFSQRARYFNDDSVIAIDYPNERVAIQSPIGDDMLLVSGNIHADFLVGDASKITNLTGPGLNDSHSLNSEGGQFKDVVFADNSGRLGIHTNTPNARLHIKGSVVFRGGVDDKKDDYIVPDGPLLLWDPARAAFRSGIFNQRFSSTDIAPYSIGFGEDVIIKSRYSSILGGQNHAIRPYSEASVIVGGQSHTIADKHAVIVGGFDHLLTGEWSVVFGGREHQVTGDYNVILGGKINRVDGKFNTVIGNQNTVISDLSVVLGNQNVVLGDQSLAFGSDIRLSQDHPMSLMYSDASEPLKSGQPQQMVVQSRNGLGINMAPVPGHALSVSGNIKATRFIGDGQHLTNIISGQDHWRQQIDTPTGIYYMGGPVSVGTTDSMASLTVAGGIAVGEANQASNGTLRFNDLGLQFYHDGWVPVDSEDTNTTLKPGPSLLLDNGVFSIDQMDAMPWNALFFNGETWSPKKNQVWDFYQHGVHIDIKFLMAKNIESNENGAMVIESHIDDASTSHPLVVGVTDSLRFSPGQNRLLFNVDASGSDIHMVDSDNKDSTKQFGGMLTVDEGGMTLQQTLKPYALNEPVSLRTLMQLTPTAMAFHQFPPVVTFDTRGSVSFKKTVLDHGGAGIGHLSRWAQSKYTNQMPDHPHYLFFNDGQLNLMAGLDDSSQPILLKVGTQAKAKFNADGELVVGDGTARGKLSVFGGGLSFNAQGTNVGID
ncbi:MAG: hypothetical protein ISQ13_03905, partial [Candidatus Margulisbacteria bacterium]|nr:hypothetical protein [Candidatus Margulisiibacteriota bacterium]